MKRASVILSLCLTLCLVGITPALADYPEKPVTAYLPLPAGGTTDVFVRTIAPHMENFWVNR
jgi:tripartite-type tricarboxylate transporter receptor subunit TctC